MTDPAPPPGHTTAAVGEVDSLPSEYAGEIDPLDENPEEIDHFSDAVAEPMPAAEPMPEAPQKRRSSKASSKKSTKEEPQGMTRADWMAMPKRFAFVALIITVMWLGLLSIYWGALYHRERRVGNMKYLVAIEDDYFPLTNSTLRSPIVGDVVQQMLGSMGELGDFVYDPELAEKAARANKTITEEIMHQVHHQKYWGAIHVAANASQIVYQSLLSADANSAASNQSQTLLAAYYESGRHFSALSQYVTRNLRNISLSWDTQYAPIVSSYMVGNYLTSEQRNDIVVASQNSSGGVVFSRMPQFQLVDMRPGQSPAVLGPSELGLVYAQLFSFHQFNFAAELHNTVRERLRFRHFVFYRFCVSQVSHLMLALVYSLMTIAFRVSVSVCYGHSGFLVLWITMYLYISASGGWNECFGTIVTYKDVRWLQPAFIIFNIVINISPTFAPFELLPGVFRYGYAIPMYNAYEAMKVVFFDTWKGTLLRNYAVLLTWIICTNILLAGILLYISHDMRRIKAEKAEAEKQQVQEAIEKAEKKG